MEDVLSVFYQYLLLQLLSFGLELKLAGVTINVKNYYYEKHD